jgi:hypothetical protein
MIVKSNVIKKYFTVAKVYFLKGDLFFTFLKLPEATGALWFMSSSLFS